LRWIRKDIPDEFYTSKAMIGNHGGGIKSMKELFLQYRKRFEWEQRSFMQYHCIKRINPAWRWRKNDHF
jgi:hypothetical protein